MNKKPRTWRKKAKTENDLSPLLEAVDSNESMDLVIDKELEVNVSVMKKVFQDCSDVNIRQFDIEKELKATIVYIDALIDSETVQEHVLKPLVSFFRPNEKTDSKGLIDTQMIDQDIISAVQTDLVQNYTDAVNAVLVGFTVMFVDGSDNALVIKARGGTRRSIAEPTGESVIRGPREGFVENLRINTALLRFKLKSPRLKTVEFVIGEHTQTIVDLVYIEGLIDPKVLEEVKKRLNRIEIDGVLESGYIEEMIEDNPYSPFPQLQYTERPDTVAAHLLEGKFAIFVDGTPFVLIGPITVWQMLQSSEDYYERFTIGNFIRWIRFIFLFFALFTPALYIAVTTFHQDMLPTTLILSIAAAREAIPFPAIVEALIMELAFEALREASVRLPKAIGATVGILGALVVGQAAVEAGIVSAPMVIVVSMTGIASFTIPRFNFAISIRLLRFPLMFLAATFGLFGIIIGTVLIAVHLCGLRSFGVPYLSGVAPYQNDEIKDILARAPWWDMIFRPTSFSKQNRKRMTKQQKPYPGKGDQS